jgi:hypothetical protein
LLFNQLAMPSHVPVRIIASKRFSDHQGHNLLGGYLAASSCKLSGWEATLAQRAVAWVLRRVPGYGDLPPAISYHLLLVNFLCRLPLSWTGLLHIIWGDPLIDHLRRPARCIVTLHQPYECWDEKTWQ